MILSGVLVLDCSRIDRMFTNIFCSRGSSILLIQLQDQCSFTYARQQVHRRYMLYMLAV